MDHAAAPALRCEGVTKEFGGGVTALAGLDLEVPRGAFFGLLGPNGAGKTTLIRSIVGLTEPTGGTISVFGVPAWGPRAAEARRTIGYAPQDVALDRFVPVRELLTLHGRYFGMSRADARTRADEMLRAFDLSAKSTSYAHLLSGGMRRRLLLARALLHRPRLVILDEPTAGVDLELRHDLWAYIRSLHADGTSILLTTHYIEEAEALCERVAFIRSGRIVADGAPGDLRERYAAPRLEDVYLQVVGR
ncbi:ABC transporter ATP-binding protein [Miltoncostaea marina]|uniref:ABC transporter ATP-binding protein n=1 Tax=Miltoncostaea marina TaxID=2843215 RepID=UPI001C3D522A|nr:ABC transporter ATP-binding protein [Miltoncostaea marina]